MAVSSRPDPRAHQKERTKQAIVDAAMAIWREGRMPSVAAAAERAKVSRATAYRYFPTQHHLGEEMAGHDPFMAIVNEAVENLATEDVEERLLALLASYNRITVTNEPYMRNSLRTLIDNWLDERHEGTERPFGRSQTRLEWLDEVLRPLGELPPAIRKRLRAGLTLTLGIESVVTLKDVCRLDNRETLAVLDWVALALLHTALREAGRRQ